MARAVLIVMDSVGCGGAADAAAFGDAGADTLGHIAESCAAGRGDRAGLRAGPLRLPFLEGCGLALAMEASTGRRPPGLARPDRTTGWGYGVEIAPGKDTPSGHWEIAGSPAPVALTTFPDARPAFPPSLIRALVAEGGLPGVLGDQHANGIAIIDELGAAHVETGQPIVYTSADSVMQIAAHEETFGLERLYDLCRIGRRLCDPLGVGRVIARPFVGTPETGFRRTANRKDFAMPPPDGTLLDRAAADGRAIVTVGKIGDIFAHRATGTEVKGVDNDDLFDKMLVGLDDLPDGGLLFANFVDFDSEFGHRRDVPGYAACLEALDRRLPALEAQLGPDDLVIVTADHGNDPTFRGTDHTREHVPVLAFGPAAAAHRPIGRRATYADLGATVARHLGLPPPRTGTAW